jgi:hypothetical protein
MLPLFRDTALYYGATHGQHLELYAGDFHGKYNVVPQNVTCHDIG